MKRSHILLLCLAVCCVGCVGSSLLLAYEGSLPVEVEYDDLGFPRPVQVFPFPLEELSSLFLLLSGGCLILWYVEFHASGSSSQPRSG